MLAFWFYNTYNLTGNSLLFLFYLSLVCFEGFFFIYIQCVSFLTTLTLLKKQSTFFSVFIKTLSQTGQRELQRGAKQTWDIVGVNRGRMNSHPPSQASQCEGGAALLLPLSNARVQFSKNAPWTQHTHWNTSQVQRTSKQKTPRGGLSGSSDAKMMKESWLTRTWLYRGVSLLQKKSSMDQAAVHLREVSYSGQVQRHSSNTTVYIYTMNRGGHLTVPEWMGLITDHEWKLLNTSYIGWKSLNMGMST